MNPIRLLTGLIAGLSFSTAVSALPPGAIRVQRVEIIDRNGFEKPLVASTVLVPAGWQTQGGIVWQANNNCGFGYNIDFRAMSPDQRFGLHFFPMEQWQWSSMGTSSPLGCPTLQITSVQQYIQNLVQRTRPGARIVDYRARPDIADTYKQLNQITPMPLGEMRNWVEAGEALIAYQLNGADMRETLASAVMFSLTRINPMSGIPGAEYLSAATFPGFAMIAPNGSLDFKVAEMIRKSAKPGAEWTRRINQHHAKMNAINLKGARDRAKITAKTNEEIRQMHSDSWRVYNESSDYLAREQSEMIRGVETYDDPYHGGTVELDSSYEHAWQLDDSTYILTDDASFNPYAATGQNGRQLTPTQ